MDGPASWEVVTRSPAETHALGRALAAAVEGAGSEGAVVALDGPLGAGKTAFAAGVAEGLGCPPGTVTSPTFVLVHEYQGRRPVYHLDAYRLRTAEDLLNLGFEELLGGGAVVLVEWAERVAAALPADRLACRITIGTGDERRWQVWSLGPASAELTRRWMTA